MYISVTGLTHGIEIKTVTSDKGRPNRMFIVSSIESNTVLEYSEKDSRIRFVEECFDMYVAVPLLAREQFNKLLRELCMDDKVIDTYDSARSYLGDVITREYDFCEEDTPNWKLVKFYENYTYCVLMFLRASYTSGFVLKYEPLERFAEPLYSKMPKHADIISKLVTRVTHIGMYNVSLLFSWLPEFQREWCKIYLWKISGGTYL